MDESLADSLTEADRHKLNQALCEYFVSRNMDILVGNVAMVEDDDRRQAIINYLFSGLTANERNDLILKAQTQSAADGDYAGEQSTSIVPPYDTPCMRQVTLRRANREMTDPAQTESIEMGKPVA